MAHLRIAVSTDVESTGQTRNALSRLVEGAKLTRVITSKSVEPAFLLGKLHLSQLKRAGADSIAIELQSWP